MELRHLIAYGLIVGIAVIGLTASGIFWRRRAADRRRRQGIKSYNRTR